MKRSLLALVTVVSLLLLSACTTGLQRIEAPPVSPQEIVEMTRKGESTAAIRECPCCWPRERLAGTG